MANTFTTSDLIEMVKRKINAPDNISDTEIIRYANEEMMSRLISEILRKRQDYFTTTDFLTIQEGKFKYDIPYRSIGSVVNIVAYHDDNPNGPDLNYTNLNRTMPDELGDYRNFYTSYSNDYYIMNDQIHLTSSHIGRDHLAVIYPLRPNQMVLSSQVAIITNIDDVAGIITVDKIPSAFSLTEKYDFVKSKTPHKIVDYDLTVTNINTTTKTITMNPADIPKDELGNCILIAGDRLTISEETDVINIPMEMRTLFAQMTATKILESIGDNENLKNAKAIEGEYMDSASDMINDRAKGNPVKIRINNFGRRRNRRTYDDYN